MQKEEYNQSQFTKNVISYKEFDPSKLKPLEIKENVAKFNGQEVTSMGSQILYNYGSDENPQYSELVINCCSLKTATGIKPSKFNTRDFWMPVDINCADEEQYKLYEMLQKFYHKLIELLIKCKNSNPNFKKKFAPKAKTMTDEDFIAMHLRNPVKTTFRDENEENIYDAQHTLFLPLVSYFFAKDKTRPNELMHVKTKFYHPERDFRTKQYKIIPWNNIKSGINFYPQIRFRRISIGTHWSLQFNCPEAVVTRIFEGNENVTSLLPVMEEITKINPHVGKILDEDLERVNKNPQLNLETEEEERKRNNNLPTLESLKNDDDAESNPLLKNFENTKDLNRQNLQ